MRAVIVGCGRIAGGYNEHSDREALTHVMAYRRLGVKVVGCCDIDAARAEAFAARWSVDRHGTDLTQMLTSSRPDVVSICTPPEAQQTVLKAILLAPSVMGVIIEKPLGRSGSEAEDLASACEAWRRPVVVNYFRAFDPYYRGLVEDVRHGSLGALQQATAYYYGAARTNASHLVERLLEMAGRPRRPERLGGTSDQPIFAVRFGDGATPVLFLPVSGVAYAPLELDLFFDRGRRRVIDSEQREERFEVVRDRDFPAFGTLSRRPSREGPTFRSFGRPFEALLSAASGGRLSVSTLRRSVETTLILDAVLKEGNV